jgi:UDP-N-acetyl-D-galactosamine dehydrogenase
MILVNKEYAYSKKYSVIVLAVSHSDFLKLDIPNLCLPHSMVYDIKGFLPMAFVDEKL